MSNEGIHSSGTLVHKQFSCGLDSSYTHCLIYDHLVYYYIATHTTCVCYVIHDEGYLARHITHQNHSRDLICLLPLLVNDSKLCIKLIRDQLGTLDTTSIWRNNDLVPWWCGLEYHSCAVVVDMYIEYIPGIFFRIYFTIRGSA